MVSIEEMTEQQDALLARYAEQAAELAGALQARALAAADDAAMAELSLAFQRTGRSLRQTLALRLKLRRDAVRVSPLEHVRRRWTERQAILARRDDVEMALSEDLGDREDLTDDLELILLEESRQPGFLDEDVDVMALKIGRRLRGIAGQHHVDPEPRAPEPAPPAPRSAPPTLRDPVPDPVFDTPPRESQPTPPTAQAADYDFLDRVIEKSSRHIGGDGPWRSG